MFYDVWFYCVCYEIGKPLTTLSFADVTVVIVMYSSAERLSNSEAESSAGLSEAKEGS